MLNPDTQYQNGVDFHFDWGRSWFVTKQFQLGLVGFYFQQITDHTELGATLGGLSRVLPASSLKMVFYFRPET